MRRFIRLNDGAELPCSMCGESDGYLWIGVEADIYTAIPVFSDPARLGTILDITEEDGEELRRVEWEGYTALIHISVHNTSTEVCLTKGESA